MEIKIIPKFVEKKTAKNKNQYFVVEDVLGKKYTVWDKELGEQFENNFGRNIFCEVEEKNGFYTIISIYEVGGISEQKDYKSSASDFKTASMLTSYVKDLIMIWTDSKTTQEQAKAITEQAVECILLAYNKINKEIK